MLEKFYDLEFEKEPISQNLKGIQDILRMSGSLQFRVITARNSQYKKFFWTLVDLTNHEMKFQLYFLEPEFINQGETEIMQVVFTNTEKYLQPLDKGLSSVPNDYTLAFFIPSQSPSILTAEEKESLE